MCQSCEFINLPTADVCLRCSEPFPIPEVDPSAPSPLSTLLEQLADLGIDDLLGPGQLHAMVDKIHQLLEKEESFFSPDSKEASDVEALRIIGELQDMADEALESAEWEENEWEDWLEDALNLEERLDNVRLAVPTSPDLLKISSRTNWMKAENSQNQGGEGALAVEG